MTETQTGPRWTVDGFTGFWANPDASLVPHILTDDVVGYWSGRPEPVRGKQDYTACIAALIEALPDVHLEVAEYAETGSYTFVRWIMHATGTDGPFTFTGIDRVHTRDGLVDENHIVMDTAAFERVSGIPVPWA